MNMRVWLSHGACLDNFSTCSIYQLLAGDRSSGIRFDYLYCTCVLHIFTWISSRGNRKVIHTIRILLNQSTWTRTQTFGNVSLICWQGSNTGCGMSPVASDLEQGTYHLQHTSQPKLVKTIHARRKKWPWDEIPSEPKRLNGCHIFPLMLAVAKSSQTVSRIPTNKAKFGNYFREKSYSEFYQKPSSNILKCYSWFQMYLHNCKRSRRQFQEGPINMNRVWTTGRICRLCRLTQIIWHNASCFLIW